MTATHAVETHTETAADLRYLRGRGTLLGGLRPKCSVIDEMGRLSIGKFPSMSDDRAVTKVEVLTLKLADEAGIHAAEARIVGSDGSPIALIRRFDRPADGRRLMYVSAATLLGADDKDEDIHCYTEIVDALCAYGAQVQSDIDELWQRMLFSILITNVDDHLHNPWLSARWARVMAIVSRVRREPIPERLRELKTWIPEDSGPEASIDALMAVAPYFSIDQAKARRMLGKIESAVSRWHVVGRKSGISDVELEPFTDAFEHSERAAARKASATIGKKNT